MKKTKKSISLIMAILMVISIIPFSASAAVYSGKIGNGKITWTYNTSTDVIKFTGSGKMDNYGVLGPTPWNLHKATIKEVVIGEGITHIGNNSFEACAIEKVTIADTVTSIGNDAFRGCYNLERITIPDSVTEMGVSVFETCGKLAYVKLSENLTKINNRVFHGTDLREVIVPYGVTEIGDRAFYMCFNLAKAILPDTVEHIGSEAFLKCNSLRTVTLGTNLKTIGNAAFFNCTKLTSAFFPKTLESKGTNIFNNIENLNKVSIEKGSIKITDLDLPIVESGTVYFTGTESEWKSAGHLSKYTGKIEYNHVHTFVGLQAIKEASCTNGYMAQICKCGASNTVETDPIKEHTFTAMSNASGDKRATCKSEGQKTYYCSVCQTIEKRVLPIDSNYHASQRKEGYVKETCTTSGYTGDIYCNDCGKKLKDNTFVPAINHANKYDSTASESTCKVQGHESGVYCPSCRTWLSGGAPRPLVDHKVNSWYHIKYSTCTEAGLESGRCYWCGEYFEREKPLLPHTDNNHDGKCDTCKFDATANCGHMCHKNGGKGTGWYRFCLFFWKLFRASRECSCGMYHY